MLTRGVILGLGMLALLAGLALSFLWYRQSTVGPAAPVVAMIPAKTVLVAAHAMPAGTLLRPGDMSWDEKPAAAVVGADIVRGSVSGRRVRRRRHPTGVRRAGTPDRRRNWPSPATANS